MLIDSEKLKEELITTNENYCTTKNRGVPFSEIIKIIDNQKEVGGWHTEKPKKIGIYPVMIKGEDGNYSNSDLWLGGKWVGWGKKVQAWYELPPYKKEKKRDGSY